MGRFIPTHSSLHVRPPHAVRPVAPVAFAILAALAAIALPGCTRNSPRAVAQRYLVNLQQFNYAACYAMLSDQDRRDRSLAEFLTEIPLAPEADPVWFRSILRRMRFDLGEARRKDDLAFVALRTTMPDLPLLERTLDAAAGPDRAGSDDAERSLNAGNYRAVSVDDQIVLTKQHHRWRIVAGFSARDRVLDLHREAVVDYHQHDYPKVIAGFRAMLTALDGLTATGAPGLVARYRSELARVEAVQSEAVASSAYATKQLALSNVAMRMAEERVPAIFGAIANHGDRALDDVDLTVTWYQGRGKNLRAVYAERHPIVITPLTFTNFSRPVLPLVPGESRPFGFILTAPVQVQQEAAPYVTLGAVVFTHSSAPLPKLATAAGTLPVMPARSKPIPARAPSAASPPPPAAPAQN